MKNIKWSDRKLSQMPTKHSKLNFMWSLISEKGRIITIWVEGANYDAATVYIMATKLHEYVNDGIDDTANKLRSTTRTS